MAAAGTGSGGVSVLHFERIALSAIQRRANIIEAAEAAAARIITFTTISGILNKIKKSPASGSESTTTKWPRQRQ